MLLHLMLHCSYAAILLSFAQGSKGAKLRQLLRRAQSGVRTLLLCANAIRS